MKKLFLALTLISGLFTAQAQNKNNFIGNIEFKITGAENVDMKISAKETQTAMVIQIPKNDPVRMIFDLKKENVTILTDSPQGKMAIVSKMNQIPTHLTDKIEDTDIKVEKTNEKKVFHGFECTKYIITSSDGVAESWVTDKIDFNPFESMAKLGNQGNSAISKSNVKDLKGFVMHTKFTDKNQNTIEVKVVSIDTKQPNDALFSTEGYQVMDMSMFGK